MTSSNNKTFGFFKLQATMPASRNSGAYLELVLGADGQPYLPRNSAASFLSRIAPWTNRTTAVSFTSLKELAIEHPLILATEDFALAELLVATVKSGPQTIWLASSSLEICKMFRKSDLEILNLATDKVCGEKHANTLHTQGIRYAALPKQACTKGTIALYKKFSIDIFGYGLVQLREMAQAIEAGANGLISTNENNLVATIQEHHKS